MNIARKHSSRICAICLPTIHASVSPPVLRWGGVGWWPPDVISMRRGRGQCLMSRGGFVGLYSKFQSIMCNGHMKPPKTNDRHNWKHYLIIAFHCWTLTFRQEILRMKLELCKISWLKQKESSQDTLTFSWLRWRDREKNKTYLELRNKRHCWKINYKWLLQNLRW